MLNNVLENGHPAGLDFYFLFVRGTFIKDRTLVNFCQSLQGVHNLEVRVKREDNSNSRGGVA